MDGVRINTAYGNIAQYQSIIEAVREVGEIPIIIDLKGPEVRIRASQPQTVKKGELFEIGFGNEAISFSHNFFDKIDLNDVILIDNAKIRTVVAEKKNQKLRLQVIEGGTIENGKGVNVPNKNLSIPTLPQKDIDLADFAKKQDVEYLALSFTRNAQDVINLSVGQNFKGAIIAKIENSEGVENAQEILEVADGIMVARGDLGIEIEPEKVPLVQKALIRLCNQQGKLVVTATEMLESMIYQPLPTRAEVSDVANAILDGSDVVMLSGETAVGKYPVAAILMMTRIANQAEVAVKSTVEASQFVNISDTVSRAIQRICQSMPIDKVITVTRSGYTARMISRFKISQPIIAVTRDAKIKKQMELVFGVHPVFIDYSNEKDRISAIANRLHTMHLLNDEDTVLFTAGVRTTMEHASNLVEIHKIAELRKYSSI